MHQDFVDTCLASVKRKKPNTQGQTEVDTKLDKERTHVLQSQG